MHIGLPNADVAAAAGSYAAFGGVLVGFSLAGLFWYLTQGRGKAEQPAERPVREEQAADRQSQRWRPDNIETWHVTLTVFYAMASLTMTSFLYANLSGEAASQTSPDQGSPAWAVVALLPYGVAFGLSVLMLFYGLTLVMLERSLSQEAAWAYWVVACVGPAVVLRFLLSAGAEARHAICRCEPGGLLSTGNVFWIVLGSAALAAALMLLGLEWKYTRWLLEFLGNRPALPAIVVFALASATTALGSLYFSGRSPGYPPSIWSVYGSLALAVSAVVLFALACGCVIGGHVKRTAVIGEWLGRRKEFRAGSVRAADYWIGPILGADAAFVIRVPDDKAAGTHVSPVLQSVFKTLEVQGFDWFAQAVQIEPQWEIMDGLWPLVKLRLKFSEKGTGNLSIVMRGRRHANSWAQIADGGTAAITRERPGTGSARIEKCVSFRADASAEIKSLIAEHAWKSPGGTDHTARRRTVA